MEKEVQKHTLLTLYKASAGSGKTFRLAVRYITMLVKSPESYRHILAVTFTNKATAEMKQRILSQLYGIGYGLSGSDDYFREVRKAVSADESTIRRNAVTALNNILQDYGHFRVETIDSFFQTVLRGLARELHIGAGLTLELDTEAVIDEAVDSFLANLQQNSYERNNVMRFAESNIENDRKWKIDDSLKKFCRELFRESFMEKGDELRRILLDNPDAAQEYKRKLSEAKETSLTPIAQETKDIGSDIKEVLAGNGLCIDDLMARPKTEVEKIINGEILAKGPNRTFCNCIADPDLFFRKADRTRNPSLSGLAATELAPRFTAVKELNERYLTLENSFNAALSYIHELSLLLSIRKEIDHNSQEHGRFILADTAGLLRKMEDTDTSFVFEKTGSFIRHLMIDEFQDTSRLQWGNLRLLLLECLSYGQECLAVGDVKQSIYRWRGSDWNILNTGIEEDFGVFKPEVVPMNRNFRSRRRIIEFNNALFPTAAKVLSDRYMDVTGHEHPSLLKAYANAIQDYPEQDTGGYVSAEVMTAKPEDINQDEAVCRRIAWYLDRLTDENVRQSDITILCRYTRHITSIANWFSENRKEYKMISGEAFMLSSSIVIRILISAIRWLSDSTDRIALAQLVWELRCAKGEEEQFDSIVTRGLENALPEELESQQEMLRHLPLYELAEILYRILELDRIDGHDQYVMTFFDTICQWLNRNPGEPSQFLKAWDEKLSRTTIPASDTDGIQLLTIHKSKGLEFHTVIVPYCDWNIVDTRSDNRIWVKPEQEPFNDMPFIPVSLSSKLGQSVFSKDYLEETALQTVDNLNLMYVAFTRASENLVVLCSDTAKEKKEESFSNVGFILRNCIETLFSSTADEEGIIRFETGSISPHTEEKGTRDSNPFERQPEKIESGMRSYPINARFRQSGESVRFVHSDGNDTDKQESYIEKGKLLHNVFASIRTEADIDPQVDIMLGNGLIGSEKEAQDIKNLIHGHIAASGVRSWFDGSHTLFNESTILFRNGRSLQNRRPDRVMTTPEGNAIVVDFKFGREQKEEHMHQVQEYMDLLHKMGYNNVKGHIWYVYTDKITDC